MSNRKTYVSPRVMNLSGYGVAGMSLLGVCFSGHDPSTQSCATGDAPPQDPAACSPNGITPETGNCALGNSPQEACVALGSIN